MKRAGEMIPGYELEPTLCKAAQAGQVNGVKVFRWLANATDSFLAIQRRNPPLVSQDQAMVVVHPSGKLLWHDEMLVKIDGRVAQMARCKDIFNRFRCMLSKGLVYFVRVDFVSNEDIRLNSRESFVVPYRYFALHFVRQRLTKGAARLSQVCKELQKDLWEVHVFTRELVCVCDCLVVIPRCVQFGLLQCTN